MPKKNLKEFHIYIYIYIYTKVISFSFNIEIDCYIGLFKTLGQKIVASKLPYL